MSVGHALTRRAGRQLESTSHLQYMDTKDQRGSFQFVLYIMRQSLREVKEIFQYSKASKL